MLKSICYKSKTWLPSLRRPSWKKKRENVFLYSIKTMTIPWCFFSFFIFWGKVHIEKNTAFYRSLGLWRVFFYSHRFNWVFFKCKKCRRPPNTFTQNIKSVLTEDLRCASLKASSKYTQVLAHLMCVVTTETVWRHDTYSMSNVLSWQNTRQTGHT